ncbi:hypothetical protein MIMGU_mgv1a022537mg [Erythranthe guttata]|uniref:Small ribosomal subunit protein uS7 domain-containing protein n=1 Tax=Erythranthe guttata TaxID=4155 RepID=A0A022PXG8_ERYGU|nr:hypothetical protein MIMGU_mgv1a022537mg [Erythranthe guttata]
MDYRGISNKKSLSGCSIEEEEGRIQLVLRSKLPTHIQAHTPNGLVNRILKHGKKSLAYEIIYRAMKKIQQKTETNPSSYIASSA